MINYFQAIRDRYSKNEYNLTHYPVDGKSKFALVCPGGGYGMVCAFVEGRPFAKALNRLGYHVFVLRYRVREKARFPAPMDDLAKAVRYILDHADELNIERDGYSVWGSSAGGHLVASFGTSNMGYQKYGLPCPAALVLSYPVIAMDENTHKDSIDNLLGKSRTQSDMDFTSVEKHIGKDYPPTFVWCSRTDKVVSYKNSEMLVTQLQKNGIAHQFVQFETGEHGCGLGIGTNVEPWFTQAVHFWESMTAAKE
jgi:acetyl esterase/lipase